MPRILHINASPRGDHSDSLLLARHFISEVQAAGADLEGDAIEGAAFEVDTLNLFDAGALPEFGTTAAGAKMAVFSGRDQTPEELQSWSDARAVFDRFSAADAYVFNIPMWNAGVPYALKQWIDIVTQPGWSFGFDPAAGYTGLMDGKHALAIHTSGVYSPGVAPAFGQDFSSTFFADWLNFVGITGATHVRFAPTVLNADVGRSRREAEAELAAHAIGFSARLREGVLQPVSN
ncbi:NAD(P)H-dependent oxidoreductase [Arthrobacter oryzae]|uniref:FMN-dependent NADH-azoreductase n=1 Tax=Arthrobacter oryzae TaxID=409290 RepID=UPI00286190D6|nr:NAD(P)H-dependent oxidoreductase [Arthrobacter oryzae]MDR6506774.1 FMN-dependent NADH-azoreductase [Arthrobacter oryzae]